MRRFYLLYGHILSENPAQEKSATLLRKLSDPLMELPEIVQTLSAELVNCFTLGWSHYVTLLTIDNPEEHRFYEVEAAGNGWSVRELAR